MPSCRTAVIRRSKAAAEVRRIPLRSSQDQDAPTLRLLTGDELKSSAPLARCRRNRSRSRQEHPARLTCAGPHASSVRGCGPRGASHAAISLPYVLVRRRVGFRACNSWGCRISQDWKVAAEPVPTLGRWELGSNFVGLKRGSGHLGLSVGRRSSARSVVKRITLCWITVGLLRDVRLWRRAKMDAQIGVGKERL
jgi:hypothetical protein